MIKYIEKSSVNLYKKNIKRKLTVLLIYFCFFIIIFYVESMYKKCLNSFYTDRQILIEIFNPIGGHYNEKNYVLLFIVPYIVFYKKFFYNTTLCSIYRMNFRSCIFKKKLKKICVSSIIFTTLHDIIGVFIANIWYDASILNLGISFYLYLVLHMLLISIYYIFIGLLHELIDAIFNNISLSVVLQQIIIFAMYNTFDNIVFLNLFDFNISVLSSFLENNIDVYSYILILAKWAVSSLIVWYIGGFLYEKKEFINER